MDILNGLRGRPAYAEMNIEEFKTAKVQFDFSGMAKADIFRDYQDWAEMNGKKAVSLPSFLKFFGDFNGTGGSKPLTKMNISLQDQFDRLSQNVELVVEGIFKSVYVHGEPGIGKTQTVTDTLKKSNANFTLFSGGVKGAFELAKILYENRNGKVIVFDDFDSIFKSKTQIDLLKIALQDKEVREITWVDGTKRTRSDKIPQTFEFTSSVIFISNRTRLDPAIRSRCKIMNLTATKKEILDYVRSKFDNFLTSIPLSYKEEVYFFMNDNLSTLNRVDFRIFKNAVSDRLMDAKIGDTSGKWKNFVFNSNNM